MGGAKDTRPVRTPHASLLLLLLAAAAILAAGGRLARNDFIERVPVGREAVEEFGTQLQAELARLSALYEQDLAEIVAGVQRDRPGRSTSLSGTVHGVRQCVFLPTSPTQQALVLFVPGDRHDRVPDVMVSWREDRAILSDALVIDSTAFERSESGWVKSRNPAFGAYWRKWRGNIVALVVDWRDVARVTNEHLLRWIDAPYAPLRQSGDFLTVEGPAATLLAGTNQPPARRADLILPLRHRFGLWQVLAWDRTVPRTAYDTRMLAISGTVAALLAILGVLLFRQQQRALRLAEERVSFVNRVSHELGSPLTNALLNVDLAAEAVHTQPDFSRTRLRLVTEEMQRLARLVANVLTFSRSERDTLELKPSPCVPDDVLDGVLRQFEPSLTRRGIRIERSAAAGAGVLLDCDALAQIAGNLVSNVEKYAATGGWLRCDTSMADGALVVKIADRGPGIPKAAQARIFAPFERVSSRVNEGASGTGLGLAIARDLAQRMGGTLVLLPSESGAVFELRVPAQALLVENPARDAA
jgi:signal transduction histidine kinase